MFNVYVAFLTSESIFKLIAQSIVKTCIEQITAIKEKNKTISIGKIMKGRNIGATKSPYLYITIIESTNAKVIIDSVTIEITIKENNLEAREVNLKHFFPSYSMFFTILSIIALYPHGMYIPIVIILSNMFAKITKKREL